jgi:L-serine dehydratase
LLDPPEAALRDPLTILCWVNLYALAVNEENAAGILPAVLHYAARLALSGDGSHFVSLDKVIQTMRETGRDMKSKYKETSRGGLAVSVVEC